MNPSSLLEHILRALKKIIPRKVFTALQPIYHYTLALFGALLYGFPSRKLTVIAVTGTKGKTSVVELINAIFEAAGYKTAISSTLRFKIGQDSKRNLYKMSVPGRFFLQRFLRKAVRAGCSHAIIELTSEAAKQYRHKFIALDALVFTNLAREHIESHGSYEKYLAAKLSLAKALAHSPKKHTVIVANTDDVEGRKFLSCGAEKQFPFSLKDAEQYKVSSGGITFTFRGEALSSTLLGTFNIMNALAAANCAEAFGIPIPAIKSGVASCGEIRGRMERVDAGQNFSVFVDYAHTPDSLRAAYEALAGSRKICVLGSTGGGRDVWKRPAMGEIAAEYCDHIILTNEDPYDEDPERIVRDIQKGIVGKESEVIMDRRAAISYAYTLAKAGDAVIITGKGTDPFIMGANGEKVVWDDAAVAKEELQNITRKS